MACDTLQDAHKQVMITGRETYTTKDVFASRTSRACQIDQVPPELGGLMQRFESLTTIMRPYRRLPAPAKSTGERHTAWSSCTTLHQETGGFRFSCQRGQS